MKRKMKLTHTVFPHLLSALLIALVTTAATVPTRAGDLLVSSLNSDEVLRYDGATGAFIDAFVPTGSGGLSFPDGLVFGPDANLYVSSFNTHRVLRYNGTTGAFIDAFFTSQSGGLRGPRGLVFKVTSTLSLSPASGMYSTTQGFDLTLIVQASGLTVVGGSATFDGADVTAALVGCIIPGTLVSGGSTFRCPGLSGAVLGTGTHTLDVTLDLAVPVTPSSGRSLRTPNRDHVWLKG